MKSKPLKWWCRSHNREATYIDKDTLQRRCDPELGGILLPCSVFQKGGVHQRAIIILRDNDNGNFDIDCQFEPSIKNKDGSLKDVSLSRCVQIAGEVCKYVLSRYMGPETKIAGVVSEKKSSIIIPPAGFDPQHQR